ncbi:xanthine dehydrogenase family protein molybdopterin-binding subunit [Aurantimonas sp. 22II-16-19i]|uniref:xanthine dehydrogenase family protein molybdopterin-binding subunit n=1 Tax=Aurantimonas sp. 22II-16-19i TaxID=1317114 RepID=UPI0009F80240|nr:xanthine dehydrogenase family protein molybdopterin-binding subunit [Aurantimonas sp. 22II-16-19i]ORE97505.1 Aerobic-type carbon monoxide dehydrogenase, large subunit CoxL/CutL-protein [Aurantimonas sp. 22II-16-19i]
MTTPYPDRSRVDAYAKVRGAATYAADAQFADLVHAMTVPSPVAKGTLTALDTEAASRVPGVLRILTAADFAHAVPEGTHMGAPPPTLETRIAYLGQPLALVVAETLEGAIEAAEAVRPIIEEEPFAALMTSPGAVRENAEGMEAGDVEAAFAEARTIIEAEYHSPTQHHNPMEMVSTTAVWADGRLTIHEGTQNSGAVRSAVARLLRLDPAIVEVKSPTVGGAFGQKGWAQRQTAIVAHAAMLLGRPVKLVMPRAQVFHVATHRPHIVHRIRLGADASGRMVAIEHDAAQQNSRQGPFPPEYHEAAIRLYGIASYRGTAADVRTDVSNPAHMRAPYEHPAIFAMESAVDELAAALERDPVEFRMANDATHDPHTGQPYSSRFLNECFAEGASRFGWSSRSAAPGSMTAPDGTQIGWGVAGGVYPALVHPVIARLRIYADGRTRFSVAGHEFGQGIRTVLANVLLRELEVRDDQLEILIGDTTVARQHLTAGSWGSFSAAPAAAAAAQKMQAAVTELLDGRRIGGSLHQQLATVRRPFVEVEVTQFGPGQDAALLEQWQNYNFAVTGPAYPGFTAMSYIAHFVEVRVEPRTRRVRVPRVVSIADCGRVLSPRTAESQVRGGVIWGIGHALREATETDPRYGGYLNCDFADYVVAVNADIGEIDVGFIDRPDPLANSLGAKGLGEVAMVGVSAAVANAVFHATGRRIRELPIRIEHLL